MIPPDLGSRRERRRGRRGRVRGEPGPDDGRARRATLSSVTTDRRGALVAEGSLLGQPRAGSAREAIVRPPRDARGRVGATVRDTQADVPSA